MGCDGVFVGGGDAVVDGVVFWLACPTPGPHPNPLPSNGRGGMFVADECVAAVMGAWLVGWCAPRHPGHTPLT